MTARKIIVILITLLQSLIIAAQDDRPNIIYIMADDLGYADLSCYGRKDYNTPNLDHLAKQGMKFMNAYTAGSLCTPTRTAFMTGRYPARSMVGLLEPMVRSKRDSSLGLSPSEFSLSSLMKSAGYETVLIGKWHLGFIDKFSPNANGFDYFFGIRSGAADYISHKGDGEAYDLYENNQHVYVEGYLTDIFEDRTVNFLKQKHTKPFFLSLQFNAPHWPWQGPNDKAYPDTMNWRNGGSPKIYAAMMTSLDNAVGRIMKTLDESGLSDNTIVIFTSDNGGERYSDMGPYSKGKLTLWEGGIRVPAFVRWPGKIAASSITEQPVITMDWTATILAAARVHAPDSYLPDGMDLLPLLTGQSKEIERTFYWRNAQRNKQSAVRMGNMKYLKDDNGEYLFDVKNDPSEKTDLKDRFPDLFSTLKAKYQQWEKTMLTPIPL